MIYSLKTIRWSNSKFALRLKSYGRTVGLCWWSGRLVICSKCWWTKYHQHTCNWQACLNVWWMLLSMHKLWYYCANALFEFLPRRNWGTKVEINSWKIFFFIDFGRWYIIRHLEVNFRRLTPSGRSWTCLNVVKHVLIFQPRYHGSFTIN